MNYRFCVECPRVQTEYVYRKKIQTGLKYCYKELTQYPYFITCNELEKNNIKITISIPTKHESKFFIRKSFTIYDDVKTMNLTEWLETIKSGEEFKFKEEY